MQPWTWTPRLFAQAQPSATSGAAPSNPDDRATEFRPVGAARTELQSGEKLLVEAYAAIWVVLFVMLLLGWRRQRTIDQRVTDLEAAIARARRDDVGLAGTPHTPGGSASSSGGGTRHPASE